MSTQQDDDNLGVVRNLLIAVILFAVSLAVGVGLYKAKSGKKVDGKAAVTAPAAGASAAGGAAAALRRQPEGAA